VTVPLDKRFRRRDVRPGGRRLGRIAVRAVVLVAGLAALAAAGTWLTRALIGSRLLAVDRIVVRGNNRLSAGEVQALIAGLRGESILRADFELYRRRVMDSAWVSDVSLWRILPSTVEVRVIERIPLAVARLHQQLFLVDTEGVIIDQFGPQYADLDTPVVDGLITLTADGDAPLDRQRLDLTTRVLEALAGRPDLRTRVSQIDVTNARDAIVLLADDPAQLHLGDTRFVDRLTTYLEILPTLRDRFPVIDYVDLRFDERVYVRAGGVMKKAEWP
jgi:cell division protein FtsQ